MGLRKVTVGDKVRNIAWDKREFVKVLEITKEDGWDYFGIGETQDGLKGDFRLGKQHLHRCELVE